jgi:hypothetical protein
MCFLGSWMILRVLKSSWMICSRLENVFVGLSPVNDLNSLSCLNLSNYQNKIDQLNAFLQTRYMFQCS